MRRFRDDSGLSITELIVVTALMGFVLAAVYLGQQLAYRAQDVADRQTRISRDLAGPIRVIDASFSQSLVPPFGTPYEPYRVTLRMPVDYSPGKTYEHEYEALADGRLVKSIYQIIGANRTLVRRVTLTRSCANRQLNVPLFTYYKGSDVTTNVVTSDSVVIEMCTIYKGQTYRDQRRVSFRNR